MMCDVLRLIYIGVQLQCHLLEHCVVFIKYNVVSWY